MSAPDPAKYYCSECGQETNRSNLAVVRVQFVEMGKGGKPFRSRVCGWLCKLCLAAHPAYAMPDGRLDNGLRTTEPPRPGRTKEAVPSSARPSSPAASHYVLAVRDAIGSVDGGAKE